MTKLKVQHLPSGHDMPLMGFGTWQLRGKSCARLVAEAIEVGYRHVDTAAMYENEAEVGQGLAQSGARRADVFITTKVWPNDFRREDLIDSTERSLEKLQVDHVDLLLLHWPAKNVPLQETVEALNEVAARGLTRSIGVSNFSASLLDDAVRLSELPISNLQLEHHLGCGNAEVISRARAHGISLTAYSPLAQGKLASNRHLKEIAERTGLNPTTLALRWLTQQEIAAIPKASTRQRMSDNLSSLNVELPGAVMAELSAL